MQRYFYSDPLQADASFQLSEEDNHHAMRVMRSQTASKIYIVDSLQTLFIAELESVDGSQGTWHVREEVQQNSELPVRVAVACGLSKNDKIDWIVQKGTEMGMESFIPLQLQRDVVKWDAKKADKRVSRLEKIAKEAAEQSHRVHIPTISDLHTPKQLLAETENYTHCLLAYEETAKQGESATLARFLAEVQPGDSVLVVFGSEGGIAPEEVELMQSAGFKPVGLGPRILRAETAPLYFLAAVSYTSEIAPTQM